jgi:hypothetical protein
MIALPNLKKLEREVYLSVFRDRIYDITLGFFLLAIAFNPRLYETGIPRAIIYVAELALAGSWLILGKRFIILPRMGMMKPAASRQKTARKVMTSGIVIFIFLSLFTVLKSSGTFLPALESLSVTPLVFSLIFLAIFMVLATIMSYFMLYIVGLLFAISIPLSELLYPLVGEPLDSLIPLGISALIILVVGMIRLVSFLQRYPQKDAEVDYEK